MLLTRSVSSLLQALPSITPRSQLNSSICPSCAFSTTAFLAAGTKRKARKKHEDPYRVAQAKQRRAANIARQEALQKAGADVGHPVLSRPTPFIQTLQPTAPIGELKADYLNYFVKPTELSASIERSKALSTPPVQPSPLLIEEQALVNEERALLEEKRLLNRIIDWHTEKGSALSGKESKGTLNERLRLLNPKIYSPAGEGPFSIDKQAAEAREEQVRLRRMQARRPEVQARLREVQARVPDVRAQLQEEQAQSSPEHDNAVKAMSLITDLGNASQKDRTRVNIMRCIAEFGRHNTDNSLPARATSSQQVRGEEVTPQALKRAGPDTGSSEVQAAILTAKINVLAANLGLQDKINKRNLRLLVHKRQKHLNYLRKQDRGGPRWRNLVEKLGINDGMWKGEISL